MADPLVVITRPQAHTAVIRLNRAEKKNSMSQALQYGLRDAWKEMKEDDDIWSIILTGTADSFCSGGDLGENLMRARGELPAMPSTGIAGGGGYPDLHSLNLDKPLIAAVNGFAVGGGFG
ncbi:MAG: enoyl-CoA hydratase/isomerase family protein, partial [Chloroflexota bacterium]